MCEFRAKALLKYTRNQSNLDERMYVCCAVLYFACMVFVHRSHNNKVAYIKFT